MTSLIMCFVKILTKTNLLKATQIPSAGIIFFKFLFFKIGSILKGEYLFINFMCHRWRYFLLFWAFPIFILFNVGIFMSLLRWLWTYTSLSIFLSLKSIVWTQYTLSIFFFKYIKLRNLAYSVFTVIIFIGIRSWLAPIWASLLWFLFILNWCRQ